MKKTTTKLKLSKIAVRLMTPEELRRAGGGAKPTENRECTETCTTNPWPYPP